MHQVNIRVVSTMHYSKVNTSVFSTTEVKNSGKGETNQNSLKIVHVLCNENRYCLFTRNTINTISNKFILANIRGIYRVRKSGEKAGTNDQDDETKV